VVFFANWNTAFIIQVRLRGLCTLASAESSPCPVQVHEWNRGVESWTSRLSRKVTLQPRIIDATRA
jgi:hypothetical protein